MDITGILIIDIIIWTILSLIFFPLAAFVYGTIFYGLFVFPILRSVLKIFSIDFPYNDFLEDILSFENYWKLYIFGFFSVIAMIATVALLTYLMQ